MHNRFRARAIRLGSGALACCAATALGACQTYTDRTGAIAAHWEGGRPAVAAERFAKEAKRDREGRTALLFHLEEGAAWRAAQRIAQSEAAFARAEALFEDWDRRAELLIGSETATLFSNQAARPYRGRTYDRVMLNTYRALNAMQDGRIADARIQLNRAHERQREAVAANARRIEAAQEQARLARQGRVSVDGRPSAHGYDIDRATRDPHFSRQVGAHLAPVEREMRAYADYVNPFTVFLDGLFFMHTAFDASDLERARVSMLRAAEMTGSPALAEEAERAERAAAGERPGPATYVLFETGRAAAFEEARIDIPLFLVSGSVAYVGAAFPQLRFRGGQLQSIAVEGGGANRQTETVARMDSVIAREFHDEWPATLTRTLVSSATKALAAYALERQAEEHGDVARVLARLVSIGYQMSVNRADLRSWTTLPKEFQFARIANPGDGKVVLRAGGQSHTVMIAPEDVNIVYVRSVSSAAPLHIVTFTLP